MDRSFAVSAQGDLVSRWDALGDGELGAVHRDRVARCELDERHRNAVVRVDDESAPRLDVRSSADDLVHGWRSLANRRCCSINPDGLGARGGSR